MNRRTEGLIISQAIDGFVKYKVVEGLSERTLESYQDHLGRFQEHVGNVPIAEVSVAEVENFLYWLRTEYIPQRLSGKQKPLSSKTIYNILGDPEVFFQLGHQQALCQGKPNGGRPPAEVPGQASRAIHSRRGRADTPRLQVFSCRQDKRTSPFQDAAADVQA